MARRSRKPKLPTEPCKAEISALSHEGKGIAHIDGVTHFIDGALQGEKVLFRYTGKRKGIAEGIVDEVITASPDRTEPGCEHFGLCGGCSLQHVQAKKQIAYKQDILLNNLKHIGKVEPEQVLEPLTGPFYGYRRKARLGVRFVEKKQKLLIGFREKRTQYLADISNCPVLHPSTGRRLGQIAELIHSLSVYKHIPQLEIAYGDTSGAMIFRHLQPLTDKDTASLIAFGKKTGHAIYLQGGGPETITRIYPDKSSSNSQYEELNYWLPEFNITHAFRPDDFVQVNAVINRQMIFQAIQLLAPEKNEKILDLFCGLGNFTLPLARLAAHVTGIEGDPGLITRARLGAINNKIVNVDYHSANLFESCTDTNWFKQDYDKILLDPPRSGAWEILQDINRLNVRTIVYVSCNPATLARDCDLLVNKHGYTLISAGVMDMFPHTAHVESIALFKK